MHAFFIFLAGAICALASEQAILTVRAANSFIATVDKMDFHD